MHLLMCMDMFQMFIALQFRKINLKGMNHRALITFLDLIGFY